MKALIPSRKRQWWLGSAGLLSLLLAWWLGVEVLGSGQALAARFSPQATFASLFELLGSAQLYENVWVSLKRIVISLLMALLIAGPVIDSSSASTAEKSQDLAPGRVPS